MPIIGRSTFSCNNPYSLCHSLTHGMVIPGGGMNIRIAGILLSGLVAISSANASTITIDFEDVSSAGVSLATRYSDMGVTFHSISNPFPLAGPFPSPAVLPAQLGGVVSWGFPSSPSLGWVAAADRQFFTPTETTQAGQNGILISFSFDVTNVSLEGVDAGYFTNIPGIRSEDESVTLTAYDAAGQRLGTVYSTVNLPGPYDITPASIAFPNTRHVAFNYTGDGYGFYALDNLSFTPAVPEPGTALLLLAGMGVLAASCRRHTSDKG